MTLEELVNQIDTLDGRHVVCARTPWHSASEAQAVALEAGYRVPQAVTDAGFQYFLEVAVVREVLDVFANRPVTPAMKLRSLVYYAVYDALPDWLYSGIGDGSEREPDGAAMLASGRRVPEHVRPPDVG